MSFSTAKAGGWDAQTTRTNTAVTDSDIQAALSQGITPAFVSSFPSNAYGIHVLVDRLMARDLNAEVTYISMGICRKRAGGEYSLAIARYTDLVTQKMGASPEAQRQAVSQKLVEMASAFSQVTVQNKAVIGQGSKGKVPAGTPAPSEKWSEWPDYKHK
jgi:hypothetical protein